MTVWIERYQQNCCSLTWEGVASLVIEAHRNGDSNVTPMVVDLVKGLRGGEVHTNLLMIITWRMFHINSRCRKFTHASKIAGQAPQSYVLSWPQISHKKFGWHKENLWF